MVHTQMHLCFIFPFHNYILKFNHVLNNTMFMFWNMNKLKFVIYTFYLQIVAILDNWKDMSLSLWSTHSICKLLPSWTIEKTWVCVLPKGSKETFGNKH